MWQLQWLIYHAGDNDSKLKKCDTHGVDFLYRNNGNSSN